MENGFPIHRKSAQLSLEVILIQIDLHPISIATPISTITAELSLFPASFTNISIVRNYFLPTPKKEKDIGLPSFAFNTEWVSVHLYPEGIFSPIAQTVTTYLGSTNQITLPFVVFDYSPYALSTRQNKVSLLG